MESNLWLITWYCNFVVRNYFQLAKVVPPVVVQGLVQSLGEDLVRPGGATPLLLAETKQDVLEVGNKWLMRGTHSILKCNDNVPPVAVER